MTKPAIRRGDPVEVIAACVSEALASRGIDAVLSGGSTVSIYSANEFQSHDLDFITSARARRNDGVHRL